jgi:hypothetical protein
MRIHDGDYAYEVGQQRDPLTQLLSSWKYSVYRVRPRDEAIESGSGESRADVERKAKSVLAKVRRRETVHSAA